MLPVSPTLTIIFLSLYALAGMAIGSLSGWLTSVLTKSGAQGLFRDALLGSLGFLGGFIGCFYFPWHQSTISYQLKGGTQVTSTANFYQHPERIAVVIAVVLPFLHELNRFREARRRKM
jgi:uncharacterized membrane protein YeaQ/YmgE (transglycosylase-associated protein family)